MVTFNVAIGISTDMEIAQVLMDVLGLVLKRFREDRVLKNSNLEIYTDALSLRYICISSQTFYHLHSVCPSFLA